MVELLLAQTYFKKKDKVQCRKHARIAHSVAKEIGEKSMVHHSSAFLGAVAVAEGLFNTGIKQIEDALKGLKTLGDHESILQIETLYGCVLLNFGPSDSDRKSGVETLQEALVVAKGRNIHPEIKLIEHILQKYHSATDASPD